MCALPVVKKSYVKKQGKSWIEWIANVALTSLKIANMTKMLVNAELKRIFFTQALTAFSDSGVIYHLTAIPEGSDSNERVGKSILATAINIRMGLELHASQTVGDHLRIIIFVDTENQDTDPTVTDYLAAADYLSHRNEDNLPRFRCLKDQEINLTEGGRSMSHFNLYRKLNFHIRYTGATGADTDINQIYMLLINYRSTYPSNYEFKYMVTYYDN